MDGTGSGDHCHALWAGFVMADGGDHCHALWAGFVMGGVL